MDFKLLSIILFLSTVSLGSALTCHRCGSTESWAMCMKYKIPEDCETWDDRCYKAYYAGRLYGTKLYHEVYTREASVDTWYEDKPLRMFERGCTSAARCITKSIPMCKGGKNKNLHLDCDVYCCSGSYCNAAALPGVSRLILATCIALVALLL